MDAATTLLYGLALLTIAGLLLLLVLDSSVGRPPSRGARDTGGLDMTKRKE